MRIKSLPLKSTSKLIQDYMNQSDKITAFFDYNPFESFDSRLNEIRKRSFQRELLTKNLEKMNKQWNAPEATLKQIERLSDKDSVVVIGGQQAGVLTGPTYTINKLITIIRIAREQEEKLGIPVIPIFWIAGEDHDYEEINHIYMLEKNKMKKHKLEQYTIEKKSISDINIEKDSLHKWIKNFFLTIPETSYTKDLYKTIIECMERADTYVDFFARLVFQLFPNEGIVLFNSADPLIRKMESDFFIDYIKSQKTIAKEVYQTKQTLTHNGYMTTLEVEENDAHLFYKHYMERVLLIRNENDEWIGKQDEVNFSTEELIDIALNKPELLSNNVVTRPLMQEFLFPVLAFTGGHGEISYWAALKPMFHNFGLKMPPIIPRLSFTYIDDTIEKLIQKHHLSVNTIIQEGTETYKLNWLASKQEPPIEMIVQQLKNSIDKMHLPLRKVAFEIRDDIGHLAQKNLMIINKEIDYLEHRLTQTLKEQYENTIADFDTLNYHLSPKGTLQERIWNIFPFINEHGIEFIRQLVNTSNSLSHNHYVVYL